MDNHIPIIASVATGDVGHDYNVKMDIVVREIVTAIGVEKLIVMMDVAKILMDRNDLRSLMKEMDINMGVVGMNAKEPQKDDGG